MFRILKNGDRLAITIAEKKLAIERTKELIRSKKYIELFNKAKIYAVKGEYEKSLKALRIFLMKVLLLKILYMDSKSILKHMMF